MALILLRALPEVDRLEYRIEIDGLAEHCEDWAHDLAERLFGVSEYDVPDEDWDNFPVLQMMRDESDAYWSSHGWDVTNGKGKQLACMEWLTRPLVYLVEKRHLNARFAASADQWERDLLEAAKRFRPTR